MPAWRCTICSVNYPSNINSRLKGRCAKCGETLDYYTNATPTSGWEDVVRAAHEERLGQETPRATPHPAEDAAAIVYDNQTDQVYVTDHQLRKLGYEGPNVEDVVKLNGKYYELLSLRPGNIWWIQRMEFETDAAAIEELPEFIEIFVELEEDTG